jgi:hypothetical protein
MAMKVVRDVPTEIISEKLSVRRAADEAEVAG